ncbi:MAG: hemin uptake protein HemP [Geobacter sp.]|nr:hemin uptake protein HemP [Geobacter sp.]
MVTFPSRLTAPRPFITVDELLGDSRELIILHAGEQYRLRVTSKGKLILTK